MSRPESIGEAPGLLNPAKQYLPLIYSLGGIGAVSWRCFVHPIILWNQRREESRGSVFAVEPGQ